MNDSQQKCFVTSSEPNFLRGACPACLAFVILNPSAPFSDNASLECPRCGRRTPRRDLILEALANIDMFSWGFLGSDLYIWDHKPFPPAQVISYDLAGISAAKWLHEEAHPNFYEDSRFFANVTFQEGAATLYVLDQVGGWSQADPLVDVQWYRFGLSELGTVPAWRQSLFGAATLVGSYPSAAIVLIAAGFESFFIESMRVSWAERQLDGVAFDRLSRNPVSNLVEWLPAALDRQPLQNAPGNLYQQWNELVNRRRNDVVHRANVHLSTEQAMESMRAALHCVTFIDEAALVRPHAYYRTPVAPEVGDAPDLQ